MYIADVVWRLDLCTEVPFIYAKLALFGEDIFSIYFVI